MSETSLVPDEESTDWFSGTGVLSDLHTLYGDGTQGASALDWSLDGVSTGIDALVTIGDPFGAATAAGVGWILEHAPGVKDIWNDLAGNPEAIQRAALTWANISKRLAESSADFGRDAKSIESWQGTAADSFRRAATDYESILAGISTDTETLSTLVTGMGCIVAALRAVVYWEISQWLQIEIAEALTAIATSWCTFGASLEAFLDLFIVSAAFTSAEVADKVAMCAAKLEQVFAKIGELVDKAAKAATEATKAESALSSAGSAERAADAAETAGKTESELSSAEKADGAAETGGKPAEPEKEDSLPKRFADAYDKTSPITDATRDAIDQREEQQKAQDRQP